ncbi:MAG: hypothetical protein PUA69_08275 [Erysipelotrichaceae bacterium]|nr:hypothetical protein [Erysipelotrichaceae bacterium]
MKQTPETSIYEESMHKLGRTSMAIMILLMLCIPLLICLVFQAGPHFTAGYWAAFAALMIQYVPSGIIEVITYAPLLGTGGTYLGFITGNLINLKVPCAMNAREIAHTEIGTEENEVVSTIAIAVSSIVTTLVIAAGVLLIIPLTPLLENPVLQPAFKTVVSALFGAMGFTYAHKYPKVALIPWLCAVILFFFVPSLTNMVSIMVVVLAVLSMGIGVFLYKKGWL